MKINIDAGHGSETLGKRTPPIPMDIDINRDGKVDVRKGEQYKEHYGNVGVATYLEQELKRCGITTLKTGWDDENAKNDPDTDLKARQNAILKAKCDYSISIHFNAFGDGSSFTSAEGVGIYIHNKYPGQSRQLAEAVLKHLVGGGKQNNRGINANALAICNCKTMNLKGALLIELAFMTNEKESTTMMLNDSFWRESAVEICKGVCEYTGIKYVSEEYIPTKAITPESSIMDIKWAQEKLNVVLPNWMLKLTVDGFYGPRTRIAVLIYWDILGWGKHMNDDGKKIGSSSREALAEGRKN